jgi:two-component system, LytTR family, response regulator
MPKIRTLIVDDETLARKRVRRLLLGDPDIDVLAECASGGAAVAAIRQHRPELLFLDIQMPGGDGFEVLRQVSGDAEAQPVPEVVFVTAHDQYALRAFEVHALDYLLKPFDRPRFQKCLRQAKERIARNHASGSSQRLAELLESLKPGPKYAERLIVKSAGRVVFLKTDDIDWVEAADNYVRLHVAAESHLMRETMNSLAVQLDPARFLRIHRSTIVNVDRIDQLQPWFRGDYVVRLRDGTKLTMSRGYRDKVQAALGRPF